MGQIRDDNILLGITLVLKELRDMKGVSQEDVYNETNIHIGRIESANTNLTVSTLAELLKYFNIKFSDFFAKVENKEREFTKK
jgi:transcriptional regulator with XRE-family HTH domain